MLFRSRGSAPEMASYLNGRIYSLIVRVAASDASTIQNAEGYVNTKTKAF